MFNLVRNFPEHRESFTDLNASLMNIINAITLALGPFLSNILYDAFSLEGVCIIYGVFVVGTAFVFLIGLAGEPSNLSPVS